MTSLFFYYCLPIYRHFENINCYANTHSKVTTTYAVMYNFGLLISAPCIVNEKTSLPQDYVPMKMYDLGINKESLEQLSSFCNLENSFGNKHSQVIYLQQALYT